MCVYDHYECGCLCSFNNIDIAQKAAAEKTIIHKTISCHKKWLSGKSNAN
jgi:hypothetical protein